MNRYRAPPSYRILGVSEEEIKELRQVFDMIDTKKEGFIKVEELNYYLKLMDRPEKCKRLTHVERGHGFIPRNYEELSFEDFVEIVRDHTSLIEGNKARIAAPKLSKDASRHLREQALQAEREEKE